MGRKKKNRTPNPKESCRETHEDAASPSCQDENESDVPLDDWLDVRLVRPQSTSGARNSHKEPLVYLTEQDAYRIDVLNGDSVLVLSRESDKNVVTVTATAVCSVRIISNGATTGKITSPAGTLSPGKKSMRLSQGSCQVTPSSLVTFLSVPDGESCAGVASPQNTPISTPQMPPPSAATPSKSGFSFAKGGGGDLLISPSSQTTTTPQTPSTPSRPVSSSLWIIPLQCPLGERLSKMICCDATRVHLHVLSDSLACLKSQRVLQRLVLATHADRFIHQGDTIGISFQGKALEMEIDKVEGHSMGVIDVLSDGIANISVNPVLKGSEETIVNALRNGLQERERQERVTLYKLGYESEIVLAFNDTESSVDADKLHMSADSDSPGKEHRVVAGLDTTLQQVKALLLPPLTRPDLFKDHSLRPPRGVLLHGPSGVGKSLLAQQIKLDLQSDVNVRSISCTSLQSHTAVVGEAERQLTGLFQSVGQDHQKAGTLLILDDIHLICSKRGGSNQGADRLAATLLALLDGIGGSTNGEDQQNFVILGITSNPSLLDPALRRPGRLDAEVEVPIPDEVTRAEILKFQLEHLGPDVSMPHLEDTDFMSLSRLAKGFNGADVMLAVKEALRKAIVSLPDCAPHTISLTQEQLQESIRATKPSTISSITVEIPQVRWEAIGGMDTVKQKLRESIELPITHAHLFKALNIPPPRGVLLYGPPGCSKTLMARALATEGHMNFLAVKGPELLSKWLGESERALASLFRRARMASPCIIFFDEIDAIASKRGEGSAGGGRLLSQLLTELDGINNPGSTGSTLGSTKQERVVVVGATNRPDLLDNALTRPGRIDRMIYVGLPDEASRARIFEIGLKEKACSSDIQVGASYRNSFLMSFSVWLLTNHKMFIQISVLASDGMSGGFSGAELIAICREAALFAIEEDDERMTGSGSPQIAMRHLTRAIEGMQRQITQAMLDFYASFNTKPAF